MNDRIIATIRTLVPALWGLALSWLISQWPVVADVLDWLTAQLGADVRTVIGLALTGLVIAGWYWLVRKLGEWFPAAQKWIERFGLGSSRTPVYDGKHTVTLQVDTSKIMAEVQAKLAELDATVSDMDDESQGRTGA